MTEDKNASRQLLAEKLSKEVEDFVNTRERKPYTDGWSEDNWESEMQEHPLFMTGVVKEGSEMPPLLEALQQLKYDPAENTVEELASNYKDDGNQNFKNKKYRWAIDAYSAGLKQKCVNTELNATLYANRAAAHFRLGNYRSSLRDVEEAVKLQPNHVKALLRAAECCKELNRFSECIKWCDKLLQFDPANETCIKFKEETKLLQKIYERNLRKQLLEEKKKNTKEGALSNALEERKIRFYSRDKDVDETTEFQILASTHPAAGNVKVYLNEDKRLVWPVIFLYPEHGQTDFIQEFVEDHTFKDHLEVMFDPTNWPDWDPDMAYQPSRIEIYFEDYETKEFVEIKSDTTLRNALSHERFQVSTGNPVFLLLSKGTQFAMTFKEKHEILNR